MRINKLYKKLWAEIDETIQDYQFYMDVIANIDCKNVWDIHFKLLKTEFDDYQNAAFTCGYIEGVKYVINLLEAEEKKRKGI